jgi:hypothetical protein
MIDLEKLWNAMPRDVQRKISCHDLKRIVDNYNAPEGWFDPAPGHPEIPLDFETPAHCPPRYVHGVCGNSPCTCPPLHPRPVPEKSRIEILADVLEMPADHVREAAEAIRQERMKKNLLAKVQLIRDRNTAILPTGEIVARGTDGAMDYDSPENNASRDTTPPDGTET